MKTRIIVIVLLAMSSIYAKAQKNENIFSMQLGNSKLILLSEGQRNGSTDILIGASPEITAKYAPNNTFPMAVNAFLWQVDGKNILFDTGYGKELFNNLQSLQVKPEDIDAVIITHEHGDHIGGLLRNGQLAFPKATIYVSHAEYNYWTSDEEMNKVPESNREGFLLARKAMAAYKNQLHLFEPNAIHPPYNNELCYGIRAIATYGHTPGHTAYLISSGKEQLLIWGDLTHAMAVQMPHPEIPVSYDVNPKQAAESRAVILKYISEHKIPIAGMHIPYPSIGIIEKAGTGYRFVPTK